MRHAVRFPAFSRLTHRFQSNHKPMKSSEKYAKEIANHRKYLWQRETHVSTVGAFVRTASCTIIKHKCKSLLVIYIYREREREQRAISYERGQPTKNQFPAENVIKLTSSTK